MKWTAKVLAALRDNAWRLAVLAMLGWIGWELHELNDAMPDYSYQLDGIASDVARIRETLSDLYRHQRYR